MILALLLALRLSAEEYSRPVRIFVNSDRIAEYTDSAIVKIVLDTVSLELKLSGFVLRNTENESDYIVSTGITETGSELSIKLEVREAGRKGAPVLASASWSQPVSLILDEGIQSVVRDKIIPVLPDSIDVSMRDVVKAAESGEEWAAAVLANQNGSPGENRNATGTDTGKGLWILETGALILVPLSDTADYALGGYGGRISLGYGMKIGPIMLIPGITAGGSWQPTDAPIPTDIVEIPFGIHLKTVSSSDAVLTPYLKAAGGAVWLMVFPEDSASQGKIEPFMDAGVGIDIRFGTVFGLSIDVAFHAIFEGSTTILEIAPGLGTSFRF